MTTEHQPESATERCDAIEARIQAACDAADRAREEVTLVAVSKRQPPEHIAALAELGQTTFGENRVQEALQKIPLCPENLDWHLIGHLQSNKSKPAVRLFGTVHSVDSEKLLRRLDADVGEAGRSLDVLLQVNVSGEASKFGIAPEALKAVIEASFSCMNLNLTGLMTMPPVVADPADARPWFEALRLLRDRMREATGVPLDELSMGMSHDFEQAILEGATCIRVGTALFGKRT